MSYEEIGSIRATGPSWLGRSHACGSRDDGGLTDGVTPQAYRNACRGKPQESSDTFEPSVLS